MVSPALCVLAAALVVIAPALAVSAATPPDTLDGWWRVEAIDGKAVPAQATKSSYVVFHGGAVNGRDGCNGYWGTYRTVGHNLHIDLEGVTTAFCRGVDDPDLMRRGSRITGALGEADTVRGDRDRLTLIGTGRTVLELRRAPEEDRINPLFLDGGERLPSLSDPRWIDRPTQAQVWQSFSLEERSISSSVQAACAVDGAGQLADCRVIYPTGGPDGSVRSLEATVAQIARFYRLSPADTHLARRTEARLLLEFNLSQRQ
ncbi:MAG TPA: META domain-containing protein [Phenylobacterium sp.]|jgi:heat shock protein HslJ|uniref:META domain-containing protein n=1 Tax=Phenylobacterium sp. TaxID=1871053 RepID=UPI002D39B72F|nr:META domain-containing protein [Phenylobacterium sp.]HZZ70534.1 META domain-containing protein [Phenylobacterium sp.]